MKDRLIEFLIWFALLSLLIYMVFKLDGYEKKERDAEIRQWIKHEIFLYDLEQVEE